MKTELFNYELPTTLIAQSPLKVRSNSRLMVIHKASQTIEHRRFTDILDYLTPDDVLILNNTKVIKARLYARRSSGARIELLLTKKHTNNQWAAMIKKVGRLKENELLAITPDCSIRLLKKNISAEAHLIEFMSDLTAEKIIHRYGIIPLPPYIKQKKHSDPNQWASQYQTVFASRAGAIAAPTAGRHFTPKLLKTLKQQGIAIEKVTLHVGSATFKPVTAPNIKEHQMDVEHYCIRPITAKKLTQALLAKKRLIGVGTTVARTLESAWTNNRINAGTHSTQLFIYPGYTFQTLSGLLTNFHLPKSTLLMLAAAFAGQKLIQKAYQEAILKKYRFYSFGDGMLILP